jgi:hypothetical protein
LCTFAQNENEKVKENDLLERALPSYSSSSRCDELKVYRYAMMPVDS